MAENRRVRMTKAMIREAYIDFIVENPDEKPSVTEVCERADVNRSTFYTLSLIHISEPTRPY